MKRFAIAMLTLCLLAVSALAQTNTGRLVGAVSDPSGVVPGATITVKDAQTGKERSTVASDDGTYVIPQLEVGTYTVTATAAGHKTFTATDVKIDVGRDYTLNVPLEVGDISENVTVVGGADVINASTGELQNTVSTRQVQELPLNGRDPTALITLQAGTAANGATVTSVNGQRASFTNITRDGINIQDNFIRANASTFSVQRPNTDDVAEFTITTQNAGADQGYGASQVQFVTPRGQNEFHGAIFEYNRNSRFASNEFFNNASNTARPFLNRNQFGARLSGPIIKNKIYFFYGNETFMLRTQSPRPARTTLLPSARAGVFTYTRSDTGALQTVNLFDPALLAAANANRTGGAAVPGIDPTILARFIALLPATGNTTSVGDQRNTTGFIFNQRDNLNRFTHTTRLDWDINATNTLNGVYSFTRENPNDRPDVDGAQGFGLVPVVNQPADRDFLSVAWRTSPSPNLTNELRGGWFKSDPAFLRTVPEPAFFLIPTLISNPEVTFEPQGRSAGTYSIQDNADYLWGNHSFRFGGQAQFFRINSYASFTTVPTYTLGTNTLTPQFSTANFTSALFPGGVPAAQRATANALFALLAGTVITGTQTFNVQSIGGGFEPGPNRQLFNYENVAFYLSDQWRVKPNFTLNLGLRYDIFTPLRETRGLILAPVIPVGADPVATILNPIGRTDFIEATTGGTNLYYMDKNNFGPIFSFAWSPQSENKFLGMLFGDGRTVIRGGYRISYVNDEFVRGPDNAQVGNIGLSRGTNAINPATGTSALNAQVGTLPAIPVPPFTGTIPATWFERRNLQGNFFTTVFAVNPNIKTPLTQEWNFGFQREIGFQTAIEIRYVGGKSDNLVRALDFNQVIINENGFLADFNRARANLITFGAAGCTAAQAVATGCQQLLVYPNLGSGGLLTNPTITGQLIAGTPGAQAETYIVNGLQGTVRFRPNENAGVADLLSNYGKYRYNSLQIELRRRFAQGLYFQTNYTFQKTLTDASGVGQTRFEPNLDNNNARLEYARAEYDQTHVFNFNSIYELPFGKGKRWLNEGDMINRIFGGFQFTTILRVGTGAPLSITDPRGTLNRTGRSASQTANSTLNQDEIKNLIGVFRTPCGVFYINPSVINIDLAQCDQGRLVARAAGTLAGAASSGFGQPTFPGQVFFNAAPGSTGNLERRFINGPLLVNWDASIIKNIQITERVKLQLRLEAFNVLNRANFCVFCTTGATTQNSLFNINSTNFGRLQETLDPRIIQVAGRIEF
jgi:hypothetical protein